MSKRSPIYLLGMMGVGKSTIGAQLAARLDRPFLDTDREVERIAGRKIAEIFEDEGEAAFRRLEADVIDTASSAGAVIALGGGAVVAPGAIEKLLARGETIFLMARPEVLVARVGNPASRPLLAGLDRAGCVERLAELLAERLPIYRRARIHVEASGRPADVVERIVEALERE